MAHYIDGFVIPVPKKKINAYRRMAGKAGKVWRDHGALEFRECVGDDLNVKMCLSFPRGIRTKPGETVLFSYIVFKSRGHRDPWNRKGQAWRHKGNLQRQRQPVSIRRWRTARFATSRFRPSISSVQPLFTKRFLAGKSDSATTVALLLTTRWAKSAADG